ncbi:MAG TPA: hypothetical protein VK003_07775 [Oceanobacillus sp.]|nr:hypothetical protein [Oceanobacillus sp.]
MLSDSLIRELHKLSRVEKIRAMRLLLDDLAAEEEPFFPATAEYAVWSPFDCADASEKLTALLEQERRRG